MTGRRGLRPPVRVARALHPMAWWLWALGLATAASRTLNPVLLLLVLAVLALVVASRRSDAPWARGFKYYLLLALVVIVIRVAFRAVFATGVSAGDHVLFTLPRVPLPHWYSGVQLGGAVTAEGTLAAAYDGLRLGTLLCCVGAANALANPKRALRVLPGALYELGAAVVVALSFAPQLVDSVTRVHRARRLRAGSGRGLRAVRSLIVPVLEDALERALRLAAAMDSRGYGRTGTANPRQRRLTAGLLLVGLAGLCLGAYGLLAGSGARPVGVPALAAGAAVCCAGLALGSRRVRRTSYRPDPWRWPEWVVATGGIGCAVVFFLAAGYDAASLGAAASLSWPAVPLAPLLAVLVGGLAALAAPAPTTRPDPVRPPSSGPDGTPAEAPTRRERVPA